MSAYKVLILIVLSLNASSKNISVESFRNLLNEQNRLYRDVKPGTSVRFVTEHFDTNFKDDSQEKTCNTRSIVTKTVIGTIGNTRFVKTEEEMDLEIANPCPSRPSYYSGNIIAEDIRDNLEENDDILINERSVIEYIEKGSYRIINSFGSKFTDETVVNLISPNLLAVTSRENESLKFKAKLESYFKKDISEFDLSDSTVCRWTPTSDKMKYLSCEDHIDLSFLN
ncbi:hypothetical protein [Halobacteriovorax sp. CON-3]|uniref:hypothetical protein n=1 Tax=Halobacteriovorax sp. CON-3 TaxID=3157710 RepID=UPI003718E74E